MAAAASADDTTSKRKPEVEAHYEAASPQLLAAEPSASNDNDGKGKKPDPEWQELRQHCEQAVAAMRNWRSSWWVGIWQDIARYIEPVRSTWLTQTPGGYASPNTQVRGRDLNRDILDPTATYAVRVASAGLMSGLASPSRPWFKMRPVNDQELDGDASAWIDIVESRMLTVMARSNFYDSFAVECTDVITFGTAPVLIYEDERDIIRLYNPTNGEYFLGSDSTMRVDTFARNFVLNIQQIVGMFGLSACPPEIQDMWRQKGAALQTERTIAHIIEPNFPIASESGQKDIGKVKGPFDWREVYWLYGAGAPYPLSIRGFRDQPFTAGRWATQGNDPYGRSPAMDTLGDVKTLQVLTKRLQQAIEKVVNPPLLADVSLKNEPASVLPGGVTYVDGLTAEKGMRSIYQINPDIPAMTQQIQDVRTRITKGFFNDLFLMLSEQAHPQKTAYEVAQLMQERLQVLGPVIESLLTESLKPKLKRIYAVMMRRGLLPPKPDSIAHVPFDIEFVSMLAMAQKAAATGGMERLLQFVGSMIGAFPQVGDILDSDEMVREYNTLLGNPEKLLRDPDAVAQLRQQKAKQAQQNQRMQMIAQGGTAAVQAAQTLSQTQVGSGNALEALLGRNPGGQGLPSAPGQ